MFSRWVRYLPYAVVMLIARRKLERFTQGDGFISVNPFPGEYAGWREPRS